MLVLSRRRGERIVIGDNVVVEVVEVGRDRVRLGILAPRDVPVFRGELLPARPAPGPQREGGGRGTHE